MGSVGKAPAPDRLRSTHQVYVFYAGKSGTIYRGNNIKLKLSQVYILTTFDVLGTHLGMLTFIL